MVEEETPGHEMEGLGMNCSVGRVATWQLRSSNCEGATSQLLGSYAHRMHMGLAFTSGGRTEGRGAEVVERTEHHPK